MLKQRCNTDSLIMFSSLHLMWAETVTKMFNFLDCYNESIVDHAGHTRKSDKKWIRQNITNISLAVRKTNHWEV